MALRSVLRDRTTATYLGGVLVSGFGDSAMLLVAGIWVKTLTGSSSLAAAVTFCVWAPTLAGPVLGTAADRVRRRPLLIRVNAVLATVLPVLLAIRAARDIWLLFLVLTLVGAGSVLCDAAEAGIVATAVPPGLRGDFNGLRMTVNEAMKLLAPLAGAGLFLRCGGGAVAVLDAGTFALAALAFAAMRLPERLPAAPTAGWRAQTAEGVRALRDHPLLRRLVAAGAVAMLLSGISSSAVYEMNDAGLHRPPAFVAVLYALQGGGSIVAGLVAGAVMRRLPERAFAAAGLLLFSTGAAVRAVPSLPVALAGTMAIGVGLPWVVVSVFTAVQQHTAHFVAGRAAAAAGTVVFGPTALAAALGAGLVALVDYRVQLAGVGAVGVLAAWLLLVRGTAAGPVPGGRSDAAQGLTPPAVPADAAADHRPDPGAAGMSGPGRPAGASE